MSGGGNSGGTQTTNSVSQLPTYAQPYAVNLLQRGSSLSQGNYPYPSQQIAPLNDTQQQGLNMATNIANSGPGVVGAANQNLTDTLNGKYLDPTTNPAWAPTVRGITDAYSTGTAAQTDAAAARANALGSSGYNQQTLLNQTALGNSLAGAAGDLYNSERQRQLQASLIAPQANQAQYQNSQALLGVGDTQRQYAQDVLNNQFQNQYNQANWPYQGLDILSNSIRGSVGGTGTSSTTGPNPYQPNRAANAVGLGLAGAGTGALIGAQYGSAAGPYGAAIGGGVGLLAGLL